MLVYWLSLLLDQEAFGAGDAARREAADLVELLTPVAKAFLTENAFVVANHAIQIHGGHGYVRDHGVEQIVRDVRIAQIYEGTNGIQARDLLARKVIADGGAKLDAFLNKVRRDMTEGGITGLPDGFAEPLLRLCDELRQLTVQIGAAARSHADEIGAAGSDFLRALGHVSCAWLFARAAGLATQRLSAGTSDPFYAAKLATARFYFARLLPEASMNLNVARSGMASLAELREDLLFV